MRITEEQEDIIMEELIPVSLTNRLLTFISQETENKTQNLHEVDDALGLFYKFMCLQARRNQIFVQQGCVNIIQDDSTPDVVRKFVGIVEAAMDQMVKAYQDLDVVVGNILIQNQPLTKGEQNA